MDVMITHLNGDTYTLDSLGVVARDFVVSSVPLIPQYGQSDGRHGTTDHGATYGTRTIGVPFYFKADDLHDFAHARDRLFGAIGGTSSFYVSEIRRDTFQTGEQLLVGGNRYKVRLSNVVSLEQTGLIGMGELTFETTELPFAETYVSNHKYTTLTFRLVNEGNVEIHPYQQDLRITIKNVVGSTSFLQLRNVTNGTIFRVNEAVVAGKTIVIDGAEVTSNGLQYLRMTNRGVIELDAGWNDFEITGATSAEVDVAFPYYYL